MPAPPPSRMPLFCVPEINIPKVGCLELIGLVNWLTGSSKCPSGCNFYKYPEDGGKPLNADIPVCNVLQTEMQNLALTTSGEYLENFALSA